MATLIVSDELKKVFPSLGTTTVRGSLGCLIFDWEEEQALFSSGVRLQVRTPLEALELIEQYVAQLGSLWTGPSITVLREEYHTYMGARSVVSRNSNIGRQGPRS